jgi:hypothetical protein
LLALASLDLACRDHRPDFSATFTTIACMGFSLSSGFTAAISLSCFLDHGGTVDAVGMKRFHSGDLSFLLSLITAAGRDDDQRGSPLSVARINRATSLYAVDPRDPNHDADIRIGSEAPKQRCPIF